MSNTDTSEPTHTPEWLEKLQQESWQAEILVSGGAIVGLLSMFEQLGDLQTVIVYGTKLHLGIGAFNFISLTFLVFILISGFLVHIVLRGYWIALIGLNYVYPNGINHDRLRFKGKFATFIKGNSNTPFLIALDKGCSQIFALTFFLIFAVLGMFIFVNCAFFAIEGSIDMNAPIFLRRIIAVLFLTAGLVHFIDFFSFGRLKRVGWFSKIYFPFHFVLSRLTLSFVYRRYYYTIVSNINPWKILIGVAGMFAFVAVMISIADSLPLDITANRSGTDSYLIVKDPIVKDELLEFSIFHVPILEEIAIDDWNRSHPDRKIEDLEDLTRDEGIGLIAGLYEIKIDTTVIRNLDWLIEKESLLGFGLTRLHTAINVSEFNEGTHDLFVRIRPDTAGLRVSSDLNYYANAYFLIRK